MTPADGSLYDDDFYAWTQEQAAMLRRVRPRDNQLDIELIAEEIEDLGEERTPRVPVALRTHVEHLLKLEYSGLDEPIKHWKYEIVEWRVQLDRRLTRSIIAELDLPTRYLVAQRLLRRLECDSPGLMARIPIECPYSLDQILGGDNDWFPEAR